MKVCFLTTSFPSYQGHPRSVFIEELARSLARKNVDVRVVCPYYKDSVAREERWDGMRISRFSYFIHRFQTLTESGGIEAFLKSPYLCLQLIFYLIAMFFTTLRVSKDCDVIHCQWALSGLVGVLVGKLTRKKVIVTIRGQDIHALNKFVMKSVFQFVIRSADYVTSNNEHHLQALSSLTSRAQLIRNGVDTHRFKPRSKNAMRKKLRLPSGPLILYVGRFVDVKNVSLLLDALPSIIAQLPKLHLVLVADGHLRSDLEEHARRLHIVDHVLFVGEQPHEKIPFYYNAADALALCSLSEGMPNVILEAFASSVPAVATAVGGVPELIRDGVNGFLVPSRQPQPLAQKLLRVLQDDAVKKRFTRAAQKMLVDRHLTWERCAQQYITLYSMVCS